MRVHYDVQAQRQGDAYGFTLRITNLDDDGPGMGIEHDNQWTSPFIALDDCDSLDDAAQRGRHEAARLAGMLQPR